MTQPIAFGVGGGMDLVTPAIMLPPGRVIAALNYEPVGPGYRRLRGFERFDGRTAPSEAIIYEVILQPGSSSLQAITGGQSVQITSDLLQAGEAVNDSTIVTGGYDSDPASRSRVYIITNGYANATTMTVGANLRQSAQHVGQIVSVTQISAAAAADMWRPKIDAVPGSGPIRGLYFLGDEIIAIRDNVGATKGVMWRASVAYTSGGGSTWAEVENAVGLSFTSGGTADLQEILADPLNGGVVEIEGATSGATARIAHIVLSSGTWAGGDAAGTMYVINVTGDFEAENIDLTQPTSTANVATITGAGAAYELPAGGRYEFLTHNFYGASNLVRTFGVNGVGNAFCYDPVSQQLIPIETGMLVDTPTHVAEHNNALFLAFPGGSVQFSTAGDPFSFDPIVGAGEIAVGAEITALASATKTALAILTETSVSMLYGHDSSDYIVEKLTDQAGAIAHTAQKVGQLIYLDNGGLRGISSTAAFGNFNMGSFSQLVEPLLSDYRRDGISPIASWVCRRRNQYWLVFDNGNGVVFQFGKKTPEVLPFALGVEISCAYSIEVDGSERIFVGGEADGWVYEFDKGLSFDGEEVEHYLRFAFNHFGAPMIEKRLHKVAVDLEVDSATTLSVAVDINYGSESGVPAQSLSIVTGGGALDDLGSNEQYFASQIETVGECYIDGLCRNASLKISGSTASEEPHTVTGITYYITPLELKP